MNLIQTFFLLIYCLTALAVGVSEFIGVIVSCVAMYECKRWWQKLLGVCGFLVFMTLGLWELNHDFWHDAVFVFIKQNL